MALHEVSKNNYRKIGDKMPRIFPNSERNRFAERYLEEQLTLHPEAFLFYAFLLASISITMKRWISPN